MRTTVELPPELMRAAKARAAEQGESFKDWFASAVAAALGRGRAPAVGRRVALPLIISTKPGKVRLTNADLAELEAAADVEKHRHSSR